MTEQNQIMTVLGAIPSADFGPALVHEHVLVDFVGADRIRKERYRTADVVEKILPLLLQVRGMGLRGFVECTPAYLGRDAALLERLARESKLQIVTNTGLYAAGERDGVSEPYLPRYVAALPAEQLAGGWIKEWYEGIEGTRVRPGLIKIGVNPGVLSEASRKVVRAAAITSRHTGLAIACHSVKAVAALQSLDLLETEQVAPHRFIFVHAQGEDDLQKHVECARRGCWMEYDGVRPATSDRHLMLLRHMLDAGFESQLLISQDAGWYRPGEPGGGEIRPYGYLLDEFIPRLRREGFPSATIDHLLTHNPRSALTLKGDQHARHRGRSEMPPYPRNDPSPTPAAGPPGAASRRDAVKIAQDFSPG